MECGLLLCGHDLGTLIRSQSIVLFLALPLVLFFCQCPWPPFLQHLPDLPMPPCNAKVCFYCTRSIQILYRLQRRAGHAQETRFCRKCTVRLCSYDETISGACQQYCCCCCQCSPAFQCSHSHSPHCSILNGCLAAVKAYVPKPDLRSRDSLQLLPVLPHMTRSQTALLQMGAPATGAGPIVSKASQAKGQAPDAAGVLRGRVGGPGCHRAHPGSVQTPPPVPQQAHRAPPSCCAP